MNENCLLTGTLEPTNEPYAIAKIAGIKMCESYNRQNGVDYRCVMPTSLYGENDNFHPQNSHVIPALMQRFHKAKLEDAKKVIVWGSGKPMREFLYVGDMASACIHMMNLPHAEFIASVSNPMCSHVNVGTGRDVSIAELANTIARVVGFNGDIEFNLSKLDGMPRKLMDVNLIRSLGWEYSVDLEQGLGITYEWFLENLDKLELYVNVNFTRGDSPFLMIGVTPRTNVIKSSEIIKTTVKRQRAPTIRKDPIFTKDIFPQCINIENYTNFVSSDGLFLPCCFMRVDKIASFEEAGINEEDIKGLSIENNTLNEIIKGTAFNKFMENFDNMQICRTHCNKNKVK